MLSFKARQKWKRDRPASEARAARTCETRAIGGGAGLGSNRSTGTAIALAQPQLRSARSSRCILSRINNGREAPRYGYSLVARLEVASRNSRDNSNRSAKYRNRSGVAAGLIR